MGMGLHANLRMYECIVELLGSVYMLHLIECWRVVAHAYAPSHFLLHTLSLKHLHHVAHCMAGCMQHCEPASSLVQVR